MTYLSEHLSAGFMQPDPELFQRIIGDRAVETSESQFIENDGVRIWLEKNGLFVGDNINMKQNIGTRH